MSCTVFRHSCFVVSCRPLVLRPSLTTGLPFSRMMTLQALVTRNYASPLQIKCELERFRRREVTRGSRPCGHSPRGRRERASCLHKNLCQLQAKSNRGLREFQNLPHLRELTGDLLWVRSFSPAPSLRPAKPYAECRLLERLNSKIARCRWPILLAAGRAGNLFVRGRTPIWLEFHGCSVATTC
jgi:hypothetical protein